MVYQSSLTYHFNFGGRKFTMGFLGLLAFSLALAGLLCCFGVTFFTMVFYLAMASLTAARVFFALLACSLLVRVSFLG